MKKTIMFVLMSLSLLFADEPVWQKGLKEAIVQAKKESRLVMVMVESEHCRWCKKMHRYTLGDRRVIGALKPYISVRMNREESSTIEELPQVKAVPTIFFLDPDMKVIETVVGYFDAEDFLSYLEDVDRKVSKSGRPGE